MVESLISHVIELSEDSLVRLSSIPKKFKANRYYILVLKREELELNKFFVDQLKFEQELVDQFIDDHLRTSYQLEHKQALISFRILNLANPDQLNEMQNFKILARGNISVMSYENSRIFVQNFIKYLEDLKIKPVNFIEVLIKLLSYNNKLLKNEIEFLSDKLDDLEDTVLETSNIKLREIIIGHRKSAIFLRRYLVPLKEMLSFLIEEKELISEDNQNEFEQLTNSMTRMVDDAEMLKERSKIISDELSNSLTVTLNNSTYLLSMVASVFLPLNVLTGLFGANIIGIPFNNTAHGFWILASIAVGIIAVEMMLFGLYNYFRKRNIHANPIYRSVVNIKRILRISTAKK